MAVRVEQHAEPIPGYRLVERIGGGGFGEVWKCIAPGGIHKAIKFVFGNLATAGDNGQRAEQELKAMKRVQQVRHPYILSLERYDIIDGQLLIVMELADRNLWDRFRECRTQGLPGIPREELLGYLEETAEALDLMNKEYQLQHLDIKPQNLFLVHNHIKVADFGLVKDLEGSQASVTGGITPVYAAPETFDGKVSRYSDQYSLGIVYQELLTGQRPFNGVNVRQLILQHLQAEPDVSPLPEGEQAAIARSLSKVPDQRFPTCRDLIQALRGASDAGSLPAVAPSSLAAASTPGLNTTALGKAVSLPPTWQGLPPPSSGPVTASLRGPMSGPGPAVLPTPPSNQGGTTQNMRALEQAVLRAPGEAKPVVEVTGPGSLIPALLLGLGQTGLNVLQRLREQLHVHVAPLPQLPNVRSLLIDTDPEVIRLATRGRPETSLTPGDVHLAPLNRPSHYLKPRDGRPPLDSWLNPRTLYRIPRSQLTTGLRPLGRLAFVDNYRGIARRLQLELEEACDVAALQAAARTTGLGLRTSRPRVYLFTSLAGGTGGGMFLDVAYTLRAILRQMGHDNPDIVGVLLVPPVEVGRGRGIAMGNTYAALTELNYFGGPRTKFQARYHEREQPILDGDPPFSRTIILPTPDESDEVAGAELVELITQLVSRELTTPLGKVADLTRAGLPGPAWDARGQYCSSVGLFQLTCPQQLTLSAVGRRLCIQTVQRWASKDSKPLREPVQALVQAEWAARDLGAESFIGRLQSAVSGELGRPVGDLCNEITEPLRPASAQGESSRRPGTRGAPAVPPEVLAAALDQLDALLGRPAEDQQPEEPPKVLLSLREQADALAAEWSQKLAELSVHLIEEPAYRLAGAEEAIRQIVATVERVLEHHEPLAADLTRKAREAHVGLKQLATPPKPGQKRPAVSPADVYELLRTYPKWRYQSLVIGHLSAAFVGLRGHLSDSLREINFCRVRLTELQRMFEEVPAEEKALTAHGSSARQAGIGRKLFATGCRSMREAVDRTMREVTADLLLELDARMEDMFKHQFTALVHVCLTPQNLLKDVAAAMLRTAQEFAAEIHPSTPTPDLFFEQHPDEEEAEGEVADYYDEAAPEVSAGRSPHGGPPVQELCVLATPPGEAGERFSGLLAKAVPGMEVQTAASPDDVLIYRERTNLPLTVLEQLGPTAHDAYLQMTSAELSPHARTDIKFRGE